MSMYYLLLCANSQG